MGNKRTLIVLVLVLVLLIGGASLLYTEMSSEYSLPQLSESQSAVTAPAQEAQSSEESGQTKVDASAENTQAQEEDELALAPDFSFYDAAGTAYKLSDFRGKPVVLNFWASWCGPCKMEMPDFDEVYQELGEDIHFLMVNMTGWSGETPEKAEAFIADSGYSFPVYHDVDGEAAAAYGINAIPTTFFISAEGEAVVYGKGALSKDVLMQGIGMITAE